MLEPFVFRDLEREWEELQVTPPWNLPMFYALYWHIINISACRFSAIRSSPQYIWTVINYWYKLYGKKSDDIIVNNSCTPIKCRARYFIKCHLFFPWPNELSSSLKKKKWVRYQERWNILSKFTCNWKNHNLNTDITLKSARYASEIHQET